MVQGGFRLEANKPFPDSKSYYAVGKGLRAVKSPSLMIFKMRGKFCQLASEKGYFS